MLLPEADFYIKIPVVKGDFNALPESVKEFVAENVSLSIKHGGTWLGILLET